MSAVAEPSLYERWHSGNQDEPQGTGAQAGRGNGALSIIRFMIHQGVPGRGGGGEAGADRDRCSPELAVRYREGINGGNHSSPSAR